MWKPQRHEDATSSPFSIWLQKQPVCARMCQEYSYTYCWPADFLFKFKIMSTVLGPCYTIVFSPLSLCEILKVEEHNDGSADTQPRASIIWTPLSWCGLKMSYRDRRKWNKMNLSQSHQFYKA